MNLIEYCYSCIYLVISRPVLTMSGQRGKCVMDSPNIVIVILLYCIMS